MQFAILTFINIIGLEKKLIFVYCNHSICPLKNISFRQILCNKCEKIPVEFLQNDRLHLRKVA